MTLSFTLDPVFGPELRAEVTSLWTAASNAGGAVGFVRRVTEEEVGAAGAAQFAGLAPAGPDRLLIAREAGTGRLAGMLLLQSMRFGPMDHWRLVSKVMVHPELQGRGYGAALLAEVERIGREWGLAGLKLQVRGGLGLESFYLRSGYVEVGRVPGAIRVAPGDDRDDVLMWRDLR
ncbi:GNAT family N-acetyltransferase [Kitasatospora purpeofusca]|uniref:GNAT family N-acetyltransferase n=1 Tax=Kitasatospora purpeofusca TaxID=67352 RepID=UPI0022509A52|nr:GNAT family N-acetyltransferase [Kitasatospora purpeofusca]MCX4754468.1 GNAT family N-acetyltransferase [Kitasatospora purpeofusca]WSR33887.1 GNAT family N-acetyltransferase [Kitasatospora purpeofusca]